MSHPTQEKKLSLSISRFIVLASCIALILIYSVNNLMADKFSISLWLLQVIPLAAMLPGLLKNKTRTYQWLCFLIMIYFIQGVLEAFTPATKIQGLLETFLCLLLFSSATLYIHTCQKIQKQALIKAAALKE